jgi:hypothetical protein
VDKLSHLSLGVFLLIVSCLRAEAASQPSTDLNPEKILKELVTEISNIRIVTASDLEPNPPGKYHRHAFIRGDFNRDGVEDIAIAGTDEWVKPRASLTRNGYVLIASKRTNGSWTRVFFHKFDGTANPFLIWDRAAMALLVGANFSDSNPGDIVWDGANKTYKLLQVNEK